MIDLNKTQPVFDEVYVEVKNRYHHENEWVKARLVYVNCKQDGKYKCFIGDNFDRYRTFQMARHINIAREFICTNISHK